MKNVVKIGLICGAVVFSSQVFASVNGDKNPKKQKGAFVFFNNKVVFLESL